MYSVFLFEKAIADKIHKPRRRDVVSSVLKRDIRLLSQFRHPHLLKVVHQAEETNDSLAFATEHVFASLANLLGNHTRLPNPIPVDIQKYRFTEMSRKLGIYQLTQVLRFFHIGQSLYHNNVCPGSILVTSHGQWRLGAVGFLQSTNEAKQDHGRPKNSGLADTNRYLGDLGQSPWTPKLPKMARPDYHYAAPECLSIATSWALPFTTRRARPTPEGRSVEYEECGEYHRTTHSGKSQNLVHSPKDNLQANEGPGSWSDMFSLGLVICAIYSCGEPSLNSCEHILFNRLHPEGLGNSDNSKGRKSDETNSVSHECPSQDAELSHAEKLAKDTTIPEAFRNSVRRMPLELVEPVEKMLSRNTQRRPTSQLFALLKYFNDPCMLCIDMLINFDYKSEEEKVRALQSLENSVEAFPKTYLYTQIVPLLLEQFLKLDVAISRSSEQPKNPNSPKISGGRSSSVQENKSEKHPLVAERLVKAFASIVQKASLKEYGSYLEGYTIDFFKKPKCIQSKTEIVKNMTAFTKHASTNLIEELMVPTVCECLESAEENAKIAAMKSMKEMFAYFQQSELEQVVLRNAIEAFGFGKNQDALQVAALQCMGLLLRLLSREIVQESLIPFLADVTQHLREEIDSSPRPAQESNPPNEDFRTVMSTLYCLLDALDVPHTDSEDSADNTQYRVIPAVTVNPPTLYSPQEDIHERPGSSPVSRKSVARPAVPFVPMLHPNQLRALEQSPNLVRRASAHVIMPLPSNTEPVQNQNSPDESRKDSSHQSFLGIRIPSMNNLRRHSCDARKSPTINGPAPTLRIEGSRESLSRRSSENSLYNQKPSGFLDSQDSDLLTARVCEGPFISAPSSRPGSRRASNAGSMDWNIDSFSGQKKGSISVSASTKGLLGTELGAVPTSRRTSFNALGDTVRFQDDHLNP
ncbi:unnamed protein product [Calicophoron daubneyi]|uniref:Protein kinase domain-containing protein n=1 Tax=Calicophoron daubneyi TaxID=300641 RepID=A0AAV2T170_CALDB